MYIKTTTPIPMYKKCSIEIQSTNQYRLFYPINEEYGIMWVSTDGEM